MLKAFGVTSPCLKINLEETSFFLRPSPDAETIPSDDPIIRGTLVMTLPKMKRIKSLAVRIVAQHNLSLPDLAYEVTRRTVAEVFLQEGKERLYEKGEHTFSFALVVPSSTAPFERCAHGRIVHTINAVAESDGNSLLSSPIEASVPIYLVGNPAPIGETCDLNMRTEGFREELGPYAMATAAQHLTVGGLLTFDFFLANAPTTLRIISVSATLFAHYTIQSVQRPNIPPQYASKKTRLFILDANHPPCSDDTKVLVMGNGGLITPPLSATNSNDSADGSCSCAAGPSQGQQRTKDQKQKRGSVLVRPDDVPLQIIEAGGSYQLTHLARLPNDDLMRPSSLKGSNTPIFTRHELALEIRFVHVGKDGTPSKPLVLRSEHPIIISSCCCMLSSLLVPAYSEALDTSPAVLAANALPSWNRKACMASCVCEHSKDDLIAQYRAADDRLRSEQRQTGGHNWNNSLSSGGGGSTTVVVSWDRLEGTKFEYAPVECQTDSQTYAQN